MVHFYLAFWYIFSWRLTISKERKKKIAFTRPFLHVKHAIYTNINNQSFYSLRDLEGRKVALTKNFFIQKYLAKHYPKIKQVLVEDQLQALQLLSFGKVDAVVGKQACSARVWTFSVTLSVNYPTSSHS
jgi:ABC-type amino acid transport substrate-binding protein